jgi:hypothetical protein
MEILHVKPLENEDGLEEVKKYLNFLFLSFFIKIGNSGKKTPMGDFVKKNPDMFFSPKRRSDDV